MAATKTLRHAAQFRFTRLVEASSFRAWCHVNEHDPECGRPDFVGQIEDGPNGWRVDYFVDDGKWPIAHAVATGIAFHGRRLAT